MLTRPDAEPDVRKIAALRANNGLGDLIFVLPALEALRSAYPEAEIVLLAGGWHAGFLSARPCPVDRIVTVPPSRGVREEPDMEEDPEEFERFFDAMVDERFDLAIQLHGGGRYSNPFVRRLGAGLTIGLKTPDAPRLDRWVPYVYHQSEILRYLEVVSLIGATTSLLEPRVSVTEEDLAEARRVVPEAKEPLVALHPGATAPQRRWPVEKFAAVGNTLAAAGAHVVVTGTQPEEELVGAVVDAMNAGAQDLCGLLSLGGLAGLLSRCGVVVSNDSGPLHLAAAVGAATVGIYWCGDFLNSGPLTRTRHRPAISWRLTCPICGLDCTRGTCNHAASFVADVPAREVTNFALDLLELPRTLQKER